MRVSYWLKDDHNLKYIKQEEVPDKVFNGARSFLDLKRLFAKYKGYNPAHLIDFTVEDESS